jgi:hypothetical protein
MDERGRLVIDPESNEGTMGTELATVSAAKINELADKAVETGALAIGYATQCGVALAEAKEKVGHGKWSEWLAANCAVSNRTASDWMRFANNKDALAGAKSRRKALATLMPEPEIQIGTTGADLPPTGDSISKSSQTEFEDVEVEDVADTSPPSPQDAASLPTAEPTPTIKDSNQVLESWARRIVADGKTPPVTVWLDHEDLACYRDHLANAAYVIRSAKVEKSCPRCDGDGCKHCRSAGMVPKRVWESLS